MKHNPNIFYQSSCRDVAFDDYLLLGGGTDISTSLYGQDRMPQTQYPDIRRDQENVKMILEYTSLGKPVIGICRGLQLLDAVNGGQLIQHTVGHSSLVPVNVIKDYDNDEGNSVAFDNCRSCHHQVVDMGATKGIILGWSNYEFDCYLLDGTIEKNDVVPQIIYWPEKKHFAVQFHPEWQGEGHKMNIYLRGLIKELLGLENVL